MRVTPLMIIEAVLTALLAVCCLYTWASGSQQRAVGRTWREARRHQVTAEPVRALEPMAAFLKLKPDQPDVRIQLAGMYLEAGQTVEAMKLYEAVAATETTSIPGGSVALKRLRALAEVALGMNDGKEAVAAWEKNRKAAEAKFASAKAHFEAAIRLEYPEGLVPKKAKEGEAAKPAANESGAKSEESPAAQAADTSGLVAFGDACAGLGLLALWAGNIDEAEARFKQALSVKLLGKEILPEVYNGVGLVHAGKERFGEARKWFDDARDYRAKWSVPEENIRIVQQAMAGKPEMDAQLRVKLLDEIAGRVRRSKDPRPRMLNLLGCGYYRLEDVGKSLTYFQDGVRVAPKNAVLQLNLLAVRWHTLHAKRQECEKLDREVYPPEERDPLDIFWHGGGGGSGKPDERKLNTLNRLRSEYFDAEMAFDSTAAAVLSEIADLPADLRNSLILIRLEALPRLGTALARSRSKTEQEKGNKLLALIDPLIEKGMADFPKDYRFTRIQGIRALDAGDYTAALAAFEKSLAIKKPQDDLQGVLDLFASEPEIAGFRPVKSPVRAEDSVLARSSRPLLGAVFRVYNGPVPLKEENVSLQLDGQKQGGFFWGTEMLLLPGSDLSDGEHKLEAQVEDLLGRKASGAVTFLVDDSPPEIHKTEPPEGGTVPGPRPKLVIHYRDKYSGVDPSSVEIELRSDQGATTWLVETPVRGGRYTYDHKQLGILKGAAVGEDMVVLSPGRGLGPGTYKVTISVQDVRGLRTTKVWKFKIAN